MSAETMQWLEDFTLVGYTAQRGNAWTWRAGTNNHFPGAIPLERVEALFDWKAVSVPVFVGTADGMGLPERVEGRQAIVHSETNDLLGIFMDSYLIHQFDEWLLKRIRPIIGSELAIGSAGLLRRGGQAWVSLEVPETFTTPEGEQFRPYLLACTSHDGSLSTTYKRVVQRVVCDNTMAAGLSEVGQQVKVRHSKNSNLRIADASAALNMVGTIAETYMAEVKTLCEVDVSDRAWSAFLDAHVPLTDDKGADKVGRGLTMANNERESLTQLWNADERVSPWKGTAWGVLQAVSTYTHHEAIVRNASRQERAMSRAVTGDAADADAATINRLTRVLATIG